MLATLASREESVGLKGFSDPIRFVRVTPGAKPLTRNETA